MYSGKYSFFTNGLFLVKIIKRTLKSFSKRGGSYAKQIVERDHIPIGVFGRCGGGVLFEPRVLVGGGRKRAERFQPVFFHELFRLGDRHVHRGDGGGARRRRQDLQRGRFFGLYEEVSFFEILHAEQYAFLSFDGGVFRRQDRRNAFDGFDFLRQYLSGDRDGGILVGRDGVLPVFRLPRTLYHDVRFI